MIKKLTDFFNEKLWMMRSREFPFYLRLPLTCARVIVLTARRFIQNQCTVKASSLTFYTLFAIVPVLALVFGIAKGLGLAQILDEKIREAAMDYPAIADKLLSFSDSMLQNTKGGLVAGIGVLLLIWSAVKLMSSIEKAMNDIWGVRRGRSFIRKFTDYTAILMICPILLLAAGSGMVVAAAHVDQLAGQLPFGEYCGAVIRFSHGLLPLCITWLVFSFIYIAIPNTKVRLCPAAVSGLITAIAYTALQSFYIFAQFTTAKFNAIYGSFAAMPLFLIWLNLSWILILVGAQLTFAIQNVSEYEMLPVDGELSQLQRYVCCMAITALLTDAFRQHRGQLSDETLSARLEIPIRTIRALLFDLVRTGIISECSASGTSGIHLFQIAIPPEEITTARLIRDLENLGRHSFINEYAQPYLAAFEKIRKQLDTPPANLPVGELCDPQKGKTP